MSECQFRPFRGNGAYGHWTCGRPKHHFGRHRFGNYTIAHLPRVWRFRRLISDFKLERRLRRLSPGKPGLGYRRTLFPTKYEPIASTR